VSKMTGEGINAQEYIQKAEEFGNGLDTGYADLTNELSNIDQKFTTKEDSYENNGVTTLIGKDDAGDPVDQDGNRVKKNGADYYYADGNGAIIGATTTDGTLNLSLAKKVGTAGATKVESTNLKPQGAAAQAARAGMKGRMINLKYQAQMGGVEAGMKAAQDQSSKTRQDVQ
jgi:hypothetical protein